MSKPARHLQDIHPYEPGLPVEHVTATYGITPENIIKLASNENPLGTSPKALQALRRTLKENYRYPDQHDLQEELTHYHKIEKDMLLLGNGSNDVLDMIARTYLEPGDEAVLSQYAFIVYQIAGQVMGAKNVVVPAADYGHDLPAMLRAITPATKLVWIANPNNPIGTFIPYQQVKEFLEQVPTDVIVVLDEAYYDYLAPEDKVDSAKWPKLFPNLIVVRTFSKIYGLAGLRVGYAIASPEVARTLHQIRQTFNVNTAALVAATAALGDDDFVAKSYQQNLAVRKDLIKGLERLGLQQLPAYGNFATCKVHSGDAVHESLLRQGVIVRPLDNYGLTDWLRVTAGTPEQNRWFLAAMERACNY